MTVSIGACPQNSDSLMDSSLLSQQASKVRRDTRIAGVGQVLQEGDGVIDPALCDQQVSQPVDGMSVAGIGAGPQSIDIALLL